MKSVQNIQKITKAMKMVAASKMRLAQVATEQSRGMVLPFVKLLGDMPGVLFGGLVGWVCTQTTTTTTTTTTGADVVNNVTVPVTSDKGLCGGINTTISKYTRATDRILADGVWRCADRVLFDVSDGMLSILSTNMYALLIHS